MLATAIAHPNIAFIKYWGNRNDALRLPANGSISMNLDGLQTETTVEFASGLPADQLTIDGKPANADQTHRVSEFLDLVRGLAEITQPARVASKNNFPAGAGIASSSSAFAALALAATTAAGLQLSEAELSRLARRGSGSASRSIPGGFVEWLAADNDEGSFSASFAPANYWDLVDCIAIVSEAHKATGSTQGHHLAGTSPLQAARVQDAPRRLQACREAVLQRDFATFAEIVEQDCHLMHAVMMTSNPALHYWLPASLAVMQVVRDLRADGAQVCYTLDAGPNVHVLTPANEVAQIAATLEGIPGVIRVSRTKPGGPARLQ